MLEQYIELAKTGLSGVAIFSIALNFYLTKEFIKLMKENAKTGRDQTDKLVEVIEKNTLMFGEVKEIVNWCKARNNR